MRKHPEYPGLIIREGFKGEKPFAGAFYQPKKGDTLSAIGVKAGVPWRKINSHPWNIKNLLEYRKSSSNCKSQKLEGANRYQGFISLCPSVGYGSFQIIWIPPANGVGPDGLLNQDSGLKEEDRKAPVLLRMSSMDSSKVTAPLLNKGVKVAPEVMSMLSEQQQEPEVPWLAIGTITAVTVGMFWFLAK